MVYIIGIWIALFLIVIVYGSHIHKLQHNQKLLIKLAQLMPVKSTNLYDPIFNTKMALLTQLKYKRKNEIQS